MSSTAGIIVWVIITLILTIVTVLLFLSYYGVIFNAQKTSGLFWSSITFLILCVLIGCCLPCTLLI